MNQAKQLPKIDQLEKEWHAERIAACTEACEGIEDVRTVPEAFAALEDLLDALSNIETYQENSRGHVAILARAESFARTVLKRARGSK